MTSKIKYTIFAVTLTILLSATTVSSQTALPAPKQEKLLNGLKVLMWNDSKANKVSIKLRIHSGSAFDPQGKEGLMQMLADNLFPNEAARDFFREDLGGELRVFAVYDYMQIEASSEPEKFLTMLETLSVAVSNPTIDKDTTDKLRAVLLTEIAKFEAYPDFVADEAIAKRLLGTFPYGRPSDGTAESVKKIDHTDLIGAKQRFLTADNATIAISGNFDRSTAIRAIRRYFGGWLKADKKIPATFRQPEEPPSTTLFVPWPTPGVFHARFAFRGPAWIDKDVAASVVYSLVLENRMRKMTNQPDVTVAVSGRALPDRITIEIDHETDVPAAVKSFVKSVADPITESEFNAAKASALEKRAKRNDSVNDWLSTNTLNISIADLRIQTLDTVTLAEVNAYAAKARKQPVATVVVQSASTAK